MSSWERGAGLVLASVVIAAFIVFIFFPPELSGATLAVIRFLAAISAALSAYLFVGDFYAEGKLPFSKLQVRATGAFAAFVLVLLLFYYSLDPSEEKPTAPITSKQYTASNDYLLSVLSVIKPSFENPLVKKTLNEALEVDSIPYVYAASPVFKTVEQFVLETGNKENLDSYLNNAVVVYDRRYSSSKTSEGKIYNNYESGKTEVTKVDVNESEDEFFNRKRFSGHNDAGFYFAPVISNIQTSLEDSKYTTFLSYLDSERRTHGLSGEIFQFPKLGSISDLDLTDSYWSKRLGWIKGIISNNPDVRGFLSFSHPYTLELTNFYRGCNLETYRITKQTPLPYIKFVDITNKRQRTVKIEEIRYKQIEAIPHKLTPVENRVVLFDGLPELTNEINFNLEPGKHFWIPIEFGFDTQSHLVELKDSYSKGLESASQEDLGNLISNRVFISRKVQDSVRISLGRGSAPLTSEEAQELSNSLFKEVYFDKEFVNQTQSRDELLDSIPKRFAVGSILDISTLKVDGKKIKIDPPANEPPVYISQLFRGGSCPFLVTFNHKAQKLELGTVLYGLKDKSLQKTELHSLGRGVSRFRIEEREPEISYIDSLSVIYTEPATGDSLEKVYPLPELESIDEQYLVLKQGESFEVDIDSLIPKNATELQLKINGYYEVLGQNND
ncbi:hypothetical protein Pse7367_0210 [Thalassoporum mexicanum PCC 7367]|uniref:hypothetical protein n=1 Tax=Thalassoporum mexicanum TaxID=3457544 RepID=UPI00029FA4B7|nr:hypothetical protein [Pseudanabaena sp. PCC 7367]AFY68527.1 hypothetical protein Pse7367_0210 [Pseudanabaena sp. PCC 7367]